MLKYSHPQTCDCAAHRVQAKSSAGLWSSLLPALACAVCPACLTAYAKVLSLFGVGFGLSEAQHLGLLIGAIGISVAVSARRAWQTKRVWPLMVACGGVTLLALGHVVLHELEWVGAVVLLGGAVAEQRAIRRARNTQAIAIELR